MINIYKNFKLISYGLLLTAFLSNGFIAHGAAPEPASPEAQPAPAQPQPSQPAEPVGKKLTVINGTNWEATLSYTTPLDVKTNSTVQPHSSETIVSKDGIVNYALRKEKQKTPDRLTNTGEGEFRIDDDLLNNLLEKMNQAAQAPTNPTTPGK